MSLDDLSTEYNAKLEKLGVPTEWRLSADELLSSVLAAPEDPFLGNNYDYGTLNEYLVDFLERWEVAARGEV